MTKKLDLGGTACYEDADNAIGVTLDGTMSDDEVTPYVVGDYNNMWYFADNTFDEALGSCYMEEKPNWAELYRVMKPGGLVYVKACDPGYASLAEMLNDMRTAGFEVVEEGCLISDSDDFGRDDFQSDELYQDYLSGFNPRDAHYDNPFVLRKEHTS